MELNEQEKFWAHGYAREYIEKNKNFDAELGVEAWETMLKKASGIQTILECGCNIGRQINFLNKVLPQAEKSVIEISKPAFDFVTSNYNIKSAFNGSIVESNFNNNSFDLTFVFGVLIHIHPDNLLANMSKLYNYSKKYILIAEYFNRIPVMIEYQGQLNKLFKRDFGRLFLENFGVKIVDFGFLWEPVYGFDDITWWLFEKNRILFRADGNSKIGLGHIVRSLSLIEMLQTHFECFFLTRAPEDAIEKAITQYCSLVQLESDIKNELEELFSILNKDDIVVLDGYDFNSEYQKIIRSKINKLVMIDDKANHHYYADLIINHGGESLKQKYSKEGYTKVLAGFSYAVMRKEFLRAARSTRAVSKVDTVYICIGGSDPFNITVKALQACINSHFIKKVYVVTGSAYNNRTELLGQIEKGSADKNIIYAENINAERIVQLISESEIAICSASSVAIEACSVRVGLLTGTVVDNQSEIHNQLLDAACCISLGDFKPASSVNIKTHLAQLCDVTVINNMIKNQTRAIDGFSGVRLLNEFKMLAAC